MRAAADPCIDYAAEFAAERRIQAAAQRRRHAPQRRAVEAERGAAFAELFFEAMHDIAEQPRHRNQHADVFPPQRLQNIRGAKRARRDDGGAVIQRQQHVAQQPHRVRKRQQRNKAVARGEVADLAGGEHVGGEVGMREHDDFRRAGAAGSANSKREFASAARGRARGLRRNLRARAAARNIPDINVHAVFAGRGVMRKQNRRRQRAFLHLAFMRAVAGVNRRDAGADFPCGERGRGEFGPVGRGDGDAVAVLDAALAQARGGGERRVMQLPVTERAPRITQAANPSRVSAVLLQRGLQQRPKIFLHRAHVGWRRRSITNRARGGIIMRG